MRSGRKRPKRTTAQVSPGGERMFHMKHSLLLLVRSTAADERSRRSSTRRLMATGPNKPPLKQKTPNAFCHETQGIEHSPFHAEHARPSPTTPLRGASQTTRRPIHIEAARPAKASKPRSGLNAPATSAHPPASAPRCFPSCRR